MNYMNNDRIKAAVGKVIKVVKITTHDTLYILFEDLSALEFEQDQSCCEHKYLVCDDDLASFVGSKFVHIELKDCKVDDNEYGVHEISFLEVMTSIGCFTIAAHNEHNGYYSGTYLYLRGSEI